MNLSFIAIVPARAASTRLPGKMLMDIHGTPLVIRTAQQARRSKAQQVIIATDDQAIANVARDQQFQTLLTSPNHPSGTDRLAEVVDLLNLADDTIIVNVQGDEPLIDPTLINQVAQTLNDNPQAAIATCAYPIQSAEKFFNPNVVKVVCDQQGYAIYFSRAPIPWARDAFNKDKSLLPTSMVALHHIGMYAYRASFLRKFPTLTMGPLEQLESLEQLRALENGFKIVVLQTDHAPLPGVDTAEDLEHVRHYLATKIDTAI
ncbi:3-deoxy-manno-octulosonate cytidylyltransferase [Pelistega indica]|uniref:3-deoxy-manno-octulosonate cytidylyltransferase n=1 Tax=Pelistega indica TaxID=1414851 RepID=V8FVD6_9BURK|nr:MULTISPECIES: 3-deoxy-manno-octulosonate cytidylyltransferase [Pelistega]ETD68234.1 3-deoxy-manno-octulosonate cytidylyltransferase [Pelistega indica]